MLDLTNKANVDYSDTNCNTDYVLIPGGSLTGLNQDKRFSLDRFCGTTLGVCGTTTSAEQTCGKIPGPVTSKLNKVAKSNKNSKSQLQVKPDFSQQLIDSISIVFFPNVFIFIEN